MKKTKLSIEKKPKKSRAVVTFVDGANGRIDTVIDFIPMCSRLTATPAQRMAYRILDILSETPGTKFTSIEAEL